MTMSKRRGLKIGLIALGGLVAFNLVILAIGNILGFEESPEEPTHSVAVTSEQPESPEPPEPDGPSADELECAAVMVQMAESVEMMTVERALRVEYGRAYVSAVVWNVMDVFEKERFSRNVLAFSHCREQPDVHLETGTIYDIRSGHELADVGVFRGFRVK